jgi:hypothetical protein
VGPWPDWRETRRREGPWREAWWASEVALSTYEVLHRELVRYLGPHTARNALKTFASKSVNKTPDALTLADVPLIIQSLRPMLRTLIGAEQCDELIQQINFELGL